MHNTYRALLFTVILAGICSTSTFAQEPPKPGPEHKQLAELVGDWTAEWDFGGQKSKATASYKSICGGLWIASDFRGEIFGVPFEGHGLDGFDQTKRKFVSVWVDSMQTTPMTLEGSLDESSGDLVLMGEMVEPTGAKQKVKNVTEFKDADHFTFRTYTIQADGSEQMLFAIEYARVKK